MKTANSMLNKAFTLIELLVVMAIIATLSTLLVSVVGLGSSVADAEQTRATLTMISRGLDTYKAQANYYPKSQWAENDPQPAWNPNDPYDPTNIWDPANYIGDNPFAFAKANRLIWRLGTRMSSAEKTDMNAAVDAAVAAVESELVPGGSWAHFTSNNPTRTIDFSGHYSSPVIGEAAARAHCENVPKIDNLRKRFRKIGDTYERHPDKSPIIVSELARSDSNWKFSWIPTHASGAFWAAWHYYSIEARSDAKRNFLTLDVIETESIDEAMISEDKESVLDAWGNEIVYVERDYEPMRLMGVKAVWKNIPYGRESGSIMGDMSRERGRRLLIPDLDLDNSISEDEAAVTDVRCHAFMGDEYRFELWSAGADGLFRGMRGIQSDENNVNFDNVSLER